MGYVKIYPTSSITGEINISGSKNSALAILPAALLTRGVVVITNVPDISDVRAMLDIFRYLNVKLYFNNNKVIINAEDIEYKVLDIELVNKIRASYYLISVMINLFHKCEILAPGGCNIGDRPIDEHLSGFQALSIDIEIKDLMSFNTKQIKGSDIRFHKKSVGATVNMLLCSVKSLGQTRIYNYAKEPEILDLISFLNNLGGDIIVFPDYLEVNGVCALNNYGIHKVMFDRIEAGTFLVLGSLLGKITIKNIEKEYLENILTVMEKANVLFEIFDNEITVYKSKVKPFTIITNEYPGFPTDLQQIIAILILSSREESIIIDNIYENRFNNLLELQKCGALVKIIGNKAIINGKMIDYNTENVVLKGHDLRGTMSLLLFGLLMNKMIIINNIEYAFRGYENLLDKLSQLGAKIELVQDVKLLANK